VNTRFAEVDRDGEEEFCFRLGDDCALVFLLYDFYKFIFIYVLGSSFSDDNYFDYSKIGVLAACVRG